jgi:hypothetical protein
MNNCKNTPSVAIIGAVVLAIGLLSSPAHGFGRFGGGFGGGYGRAGGGFRMGGDGFAGGNPDHTAWSHPDYGSSSYGSYHPSYSSASSPSSSNFQSFHSTNQTARFNEANSMNQSRYNEAQSMQNQHYQNQSSLSHQQYNQASNLQSNSNGNWDPYGGCCGSSGGSAAAGAAVGMMGGMAMGATMESAMQPRQPTTVVENVAAPAPAPYGGALPYLPPGATPTQVNGMEYFYSNGTYYKPVFNGSQVVYVASPM